MVDGPRCEWKPGASFKVFLFKGRCSTRANNLKHPYDLSNIKTLTNNFAWITGDLPYLFTTIYRKQLLIHPEKLTQKIQHPELFGTQKKTAASFSSRGRWCVDLIPQWSFLHVAAGPSKSKGWQTPPRPFLSLRGRADPLWHLDVQVMKMWPFLGWSLLYERVRFSPSQKDDFFPSHPWVVKKRISISWARKSGCCFFG